jgi:hypothetical protein
MNKVKIMLSAILVIAIFAGTLAFKSKMFTNQCVYKWTYQLPQGANCTFLTKGIYTTTYMGGILGAIISVPASGNCPPTTFGLCTTKITLTEE